MTESFPEPEQELVVANEVMWRLRYRPEELRKRHTDEVAWYRTIPVEDVEREDCPLDTELRQYLMDQRDNINDPDARQITVPTAYTDGTFSHVQRLSRETFKIPGGLSLVGGREAAPKNREVQSKVVGSRLAGLIKRNRHGDSGRP